MTDASRPRVVVSPLRGDEYKVSVTEFAFVSPVLHDEVLKPPSIGRGWPLKGKRLTMICASLSLLHPLLSLTHWIFGSLWLPYKSSSLVQLMFAVHAAGVSKGRYHNPPNPLNPLNLLNPGPLCGPYFMAPSIFSRFSLMVSR